MTQNNNHYLLYFLIQGNFDVEEVSSTLNLPIFRKWKSTDLRKDNKPYDFDHLSICKVESDEPYISEKLELIIDQLDDKKEYLKSLKNKYDINFYLVVVPYIYIDTIYPSLSPSLKVIDFCHELRVNLDIDLYLYK